MGAGLLRRSPSALDLCCGGGGASVGLWRAGFQVTGVDLFPQKLYPFPLAQHDVRKLDPKWIRGFDLVWAGPPCQRFTRGAAQNGTTFRHPDLIGTVRELLEEAGRPYVIENVPDAPLRCDVRLCGSMFGLKVIRHRHFEISGFDCPQPRHRRHPSDYVTVTGHAGGSSTRDGDRGYGSVEDWQRAMGTPWLSSRTMAEAIPPDYSEYIGNFFHG